jgi:hypothetical protein
MVIRSYFPPARWVWFFVFAALIVGGGPASASVSGKYLLASGNTLVLSLNLTEGSSAIIVEQGMSAGNRVASTSPPANKVEAGEGEIRCKWLFKNVSAGNFTLTTRLSAPLKGKVSAVVRYRQPGSGQFTEVIIRP